MRMVQLETTFVSSMGGFGNNPLTYTQLKRIGNVAVYERSRDGKPYDYEVIKIRFDAKGTNGVDEDTERYPGAAAFGRMGWSISSLGLAMAKFHDIVHSVSDTPEEDTPVMSNKGVENMGLTVAEGKDSGKKTKPVIKPLLITVAEFSKQELADQNSVDYIYANNFVNDGLEKGTIKLVRKERRNAKGKPTSIFAKVS